LGGIGRLTRRDDLIESLSTSARPEDDVRAPEDDVRAPEDDGRLPEDDVRAPEDDGRAPEEVRKRGLAL
jgi:hypothetical protein